MKKEESFSVKTIVAIGIGAAVFVILGRFVSIPIGIPNTNLETTYPFLALMGALFGPIAGLFIGLIGHSLKDSTAYGSVWWTWVICSGIMGLIYGSLRNHLDIRHGRFGVRAMILFNLVQVVGNLLVWGFIAPSLDILVYQEPANKVYLQGLGSSIANIISVGILGTILIKAYASTRTQRGSLKKD